MSARTATGRVLRIHRDDHVTVAPDGLRAGQPFQLDGEQIVARDEVPAGHKVACVGRDKGDPVVKYGHTIGHATARIRPGDWVHGHNLASSLETAGALTYRPEQAPPAPTVAGPIPTFDGYRRSGGRVATRNEIWIVPTVGCVARAAERIARTASARIDGRADGVYAFQHPYGCSQLGDDLGQTRDLLAGLVRHPNAGGVLVLGLGCENNQRDRLLEAAGDAEAERVLGFDAQSVADEEEAGLAMVERLLARTAADRRVACPASDLLVGLKCGGSDGLSGLTANPLVGLVADRLVAWGGGALLTEVPEMFGAEQSLGDRCVSASVFADFVALIEGFKDYFRDHGQPIDENPSPGNLEGGITTLAEKSLGAIQKGGTCRVKRVLGYGAPADPTGLSLIEAPGNDAVSATAMVAAGATLLLFTTGRGTPLGFPVPTLKIASNSALAERKPRWIDFDAGPITGGTDSEHLADSLTRSILDIASGRVPARNEANDEREIAVWKRGVTL